jgi:pyrroline-5-carboxylate reductase
MKISFIGSGKMAGAMIGSLIRAKIAQPSEIFASDVDAERRNALKKQFGVNVYAGNGTVVGMAGALFLAVKPQNLDEVLREIAPAVTREHLVLSIAAGRKLAGIEALLPQGRVVRVMPNVACLVGEGMSAFALGSRAQEADRHLARKLLGSFGRAVELDEAHFDAVTALSGSGPAFYAYVLDRMAQAAVAEGLPEGEAQLLAAQTMLGAARLMLDKPMSARDLIAMVASPKGTTVAGLAVLEASSIGSVLEETIRAAARRSRELSGGG